MTETGGRREDDSDEREITSAGIRAAAVGLLGLAGFIGAAWLEEVPPATTLTALGETLGLVGPPYLAGGLALGGIGTALGAMHTRTILILVGLAIGIAGWALFRPERLFTTSSVNEQFPETVTAAGPVALASGQFRGVAHETAGTAAIFRLADGRRVLRFTGFKTSNGPDVQVYLVNAPDAVDNATITRAGFVHLGALKGNVGDQNYDVPADADLTKYRAVTIWCRRFGINFGTAPLTPASGHAARGLPGVGETRL